MMLAVALASCARAPEKTHATAATAAKVPVQIAVIGDSLALGTGASDSGNGFAFDAYRAIEREHPGSEITNVAIGGATAADVLRLETPRLQGRHDNVVIVCVGGNDVIRFTPPAAFAATYAALLADIRRREPHATIVAIGVPDVAISPLFADHAAGVRALSAADDRGARAAARATGAQYLDLFALTHRWHDPAALLSSDRFHPSDSGHMAIARALIPILERALPQVPMRPTE
jgi:lysophospholipase L1-like esterase